MQKQKEVLLEMFKEANPMLCELSPKISVDEIIESFSSENSEIILHSPPLLQISVSHPFIFDNRLVPDEFQGMEVKNIITGKFPLEFSEPLTDDFPLEEHYAPQRYIKFVKRKLFAIRKNLKKPMLTEREALDALTGGFDKHVEWCLKLSFQRIPK